MTKKKEKPDTHVYVRNDHDETLYVYPSVDEGTMHISVRESPAEDYDELPPQQALEYALEGDLATCLHDGKLRYEVASKRQVAVTHKRSPSVQGLILCLSLAPN